jgi:hypothetical protein
MLLPFAVIQRGESRTIDQGPDAAAGDRPPLQGVRKDGMGYLIVVGSIGGFFHRPLATCSPGM